MTDEDTFKKEYRGFISIEQLVSRQIDRIMFHRTEKNVEYFEEGIEALIDLLTPEDEKKAVEFKKKNDITSDTSRQGKHQYVLLLRFIKELFTDQQIIWKRGGYDIGHD